MLFRSIVIVIVIVAAGCAVRAAGFSPTGSRRRGPRSGGCGTSRSSSRRCRSCRRRPPRCPRSSLCYRYDHELHSEGNVAVVCSKVQSLMCVLNHRALLRSQRDSAGLATQNNELKFRLQAMEQQAQLRDGENQFR